MSAAELEAESSAQEQQQQQQHNTSNNSTANNADAISSSSTNTNTNTYDVDVHESIETITNNNYNNSNSSAAAEQQLQQQQQQQLDQQGELGVGGISLMQSSPPPHSYRHSRAYRHFKNPPQPHMCIRTTTETGEELFINVLSWTRIVIPQEPSDPIPLYGGMRVGFALPFLLLSTFYNVFYLPAPNRCHPAVHAVHPLSLLLWPILRCSKIRDVIAKIQRNDVPWLS